MNDTSIQFVKGVGPSLAKRIEKLGVRTVEDFLYFFPRSYDDRRKLATISGLKMGESESFVGYVNSFREKKVRKKFSIIEAVVSDRTGSVKVVWFNQAYIAKKLKTGLRMFFRGKLENNPYAGAVQFMVSEQEFLESDEAFHQNTNAILPVYALVSGVHQYQMRQISRAVMKKYGGQLTDSLPLRLRQELKLETLSTAISDLHFPTAIEAYKRARHRVVFEEFFYLQLSLGLKRLKASRSGVAPNLIPDSSLHQRYLASLPYQLTKAQAHAVASISKDLVKEKSMNRLLQGDVGCGKTDVAVMSLLSAIAAQKKGAVMAPTEVLAVQHYYKFKKFLTPLGIDVLLVKGKMKKKDRMAAEARCLESKPLVVVGTHALIGDAVEIPDLGLVIIDEQHRFGVNQRNRLAEKGQSPHCLYMTATPIPRSFMLTCYGDLDKTVIYELPPGRESPKTQLYTESGLRFIFDNCRKRIADGEQVYVVYPLVEESEKLDLKSAEEGWRYLNEEVFPSTDVGLIHGRLSPDEKQSVMDRFKANETSILVATTVIEVGIDVPNATTMIIMHADRFGLSQLHQLRGRVGRGGKASFCYLIASPNTDTGKRRLKCMVETGDGFKIAEEDLNIRGPGDIMGLRQSGLPDFKLANIVKDEKVLLSARMEAFNILTKDPDLKLGEHQSIKQKMEATLLHQEQALN